MTITLFGCAGLYQRQLLEGFAILVDNVNQRGVAKFTAAGVEYLGTRALHQAHETLVVEGIQRLAYTGQDLITLRIHHTLFQIPEHEIIRHAQTNEFVVHVGTPRFGHKRR